MGNTSVRNEDPAGGNSFPAGSDGVELAVLDDEQTKEEQSKEDFDKWLLGAVMLDRQQQESDIANAEFLTTDLLFTICTEFLYDVKDIIHFLSCSSSLSKMSADSDKVLWVKLVNRDFPTLFLAEASRERQIVFTEEKFPHVKLEIRRKTLQESITSFYSLYVECHKYFNVSSRSPEARHIVPYQLVVLNHTTKLKQVFCTLDCIRGIRPGSVFASLGDSLQVEMYFREEKGLNLRVHFHSQICRWNYGPRGLYKDMGFGGSPVADRGELKFSYWQTFHPRDSPCIYQTKLNCSNNALKWPNTHWSDQWTKYRYFVSVGDKPFKNPGPYPGVQLQGQDKDEIPLFEISILLRAIW